MHFEGRYVLISPEVLLLGRLYGLTSFCWRGGDRGSGRRLAGCCSAGLYFMSRVESAHLSHFRDVFLGPELT